jgi:ADP-ribosylglycohydrolase
VTEQDSRFEAAGRVVGAMVGLALGDALGAPFEFRRAGEIPSPVPAFEHGWKGLAPGATTDDTAMARNLVHSLVERGEFDPVDLLERHLTWLDADPPDVGAQTRRVLVRARGGERDAARLVFEQRGPEVSAGNGSVMYCAPLGLAYANRPDVLHRLAPELSALTHWDGRCRTAVTAVTLAAAALVRGVTPGSAVQGALIAVEDREGGEELEFLVQEAGRARRIDGPDMGFCLFAAGIGLQAVLRARAVEPELLRIVSLGGDTDTNAAVAGALLGARFGYDELPAGWLERLADRDAIETEAAGLVPLADRE